MGLRSHVFQISLDVGKYHHHVLNLKEHQLRNSKIKVQWGTLALIVPVLDLQPLSSIGKWIPFWHPPTTVHHSMGGFRTGSGPCSNWCDPAHTPEREAVTCRNDRKVGQYAIQSLGDKSLVCFIIFQSLYLRMTINQKKHGDDVQINHS